MKFGFYKKFHRQNWLDIVGKQKYDPTKGYIGSWWFWWSPGWVLVLVVPRVGSGTGGLKNYIKSYQQKKPCLFR